MFARVSRFHGTAEAGASQSVEDVLPIVRSIDGFRGVISLVDRASRDSMTITLWASEAAMEASEAKADEMRREMAEAAGEEIRSVERYEVETLQLES